MLTPESPAHDEAGRTLLTNLHALLSPTLVEAIERLVDERVEARLAVMADTSPPRWLFGDKQLAEHLGWSLGRAQKASASGLFPVHRHGQRKSYLVSEVDDVMRDLGEGG